jgi:AcrR family transcriptional regulator
MTQRDADRTRTAILETAETLFAQQGFSETSLQQIGEAAGFGRSTPAYFFESKQALYDTVLSRALERARETMRPAFEAARANASPEDALDALVGRFLDFLAGDRNYVLLIQREALAERPSLATLLDEEALEEARRAIVGAVRDEDADHLILELFALCWFPFAHRGTLVAALGFDAGDPEFLRRHRERIVRLFARRPEERRSSAGRRRRP